MSMSGQVLLPSLKVFSFPFFFQSTENTNDPNGKQMCETTVYCLKLIPFLVVSSRTIPMDKDEVETVMVEPPKTFFELVQTKVTSLITSFFQYSYSPPTFFSGLVSQEETPLLNKKRLKKFLKQFGMFPDAYR